MADDQLVVFFSTCWMGAKFCLELKVLTYHYLLWFSNSNEDAER